MASPVIISSDDSRRIRGLSTFLEGLGIAGHTAFSSLIRISNRSYSGFSFEIMLGEGASGSWTLAHPASRSKISAPFHQMYGSEASALQVMCTLMELANPAWKYANFYFDHGSDSVWISDMLSRLRRSSPSLSAIRMLRYAPRYLPTLLCENPFLETLILYLSCLDVLDEAKHAKQLALCLSRNSVLKSCTLHAHFTTVQMWEAALKPLMPSSEGQTLNVTLKELVLDGVEGLPAVEAAANLVRRNRTLEKLELHSTPLEGIPLVPQALAGNRTLNEFRWGCTLEGLKELGAVLTPDSSGHQANTHVTTLKLYMPNGVALKEFMKELSILLECNTTLKHVEVDLTGRMGVWEVRASNAPPHGATECTQDMVESMVGKELRVNTSLESVVVGSWKLLRVDGHEEWQMKYCGPCLLRRSPLAGESPEHLEKYAPLCYVVSHYDVEVENLLCSRVVH